MIGRTLSLRVVSPPSGCQSIPALLTESNWLKLIKIDWSWLKSTERDWKWQIIGRNGLKVDEKLGENHWNYRKLASEISYGRWGENTLNSPEQLILSPVFFRRPWNCWALIHWASEFLNQRTLLQELFFLFLGFLEGSKRRTHKGHREKHLKLSWKHFEDTPKYLSSNLKSPLPLPSDLNN